MNPFCDGGHPHIYSFHLHIPIVFLVQIISLTHYPIPCRVIVYILKMGPPPLNSPHLQFSLLILELYLTLQMLRIGTDKWQVTLASSGAKMLWKRKGQLLLLSHFSRVRLCATPETAAHQAPPSLGFSRQEHWSGLPLPSPMHASEKWKWSHSVVSDS